MTLGAGLGHAGVADAGLGVVHIQDQVRLVTGSAHRRHPQALLEQALAVDGEGVVGEDLVLGNVAPLGDLGALLVAGAAQRRHVHRLRRRSLVQTGEDVVHAVTVGAIRRQGIPLHRGASVNTAGLQGRRILVTVATDIDFGRHRVGHRHVVALVALDAVGPKRLAFPG